MSDAAGEANRAGRDDKAQRADLLAGGALSSEIEARMRAIFAATEQNLRIPPTGALDSIIAATGADDSTRSAQSSGILLPALMVVAQRYRGQSFALDPIAVAMVRSVLGAGMTDESWTPAWDRAASAVAQSLCDDPTAAQRLAALWERLNASGQ